MAVVACKQGESLGGRALGYVSTGLGTVGKNVIMFFAGMIAERLAMGGTWHFLEWDAVRVETIGYVYDQKREPERPPIDNTPVVSHEWAVPETADAAALSMFGAADRIGDLALIYSTLRAALIDKPGYGALFELAWATYQNDAIKLTFENLDTIRALANNLLTAGGKLGRVEIDLFFGREGGSWE